jgi:hypothetical protein
MELLDGIDVQRFVERFGAVYRTVSGVFPPALRAH